MSWQNNGGGPWGGGVNSGGGNQGPWGRGTGPQPPDIDEVIRKGQERLRRFAGGRPGGKGIALLLGVAAAGWLASGFYNVQPEEQGVELVFGKLHEVTPAGLQYNFPSPIGEVLKPKVTAVNQVEIGFRTTGSNSRGATTTDVTAESLMLTGDENIIDIQFTVFWVIEDAGKYLFNVRNPETSVKDAAEAAMREVIGKSDFQFARTQGRGRIAQQTRELIQSLLDSYGSGIRVTEVNVQSVDPPGAVIDAFRDVQAARADKERAINEATAYMNEITERAQGEAEQIVRAAEAYRAEKTSQAEGDASRFLQVYEEYRNDKEITRRRIYLQTMENLLKDMDKVLIEQEGGAGVLPYLPLEAIAPARAGGATGGSGGRQ